MTNLLLEPVEFQIETTGLGTWKRHLAAGGAFYAEFVSHRRLLGLPVLHYTKGRNPQTGRRTVARGVFAVGRIAVGIFPVGQLAIGICPVGQVSIGLLLGIGQLCTGIVAIGQIAAGVLFGLGQITIGYVAIGQLAAGVYVAAQRGVGLHVWDVVAKDPAVPAFLKSLLP